MTIYTKTNLLTKAIKSGVANSPKDRWPTYDGKELIRGDFITASEVGGCIRKIYYAKAAAKTNASPIIGENDWGFFQRGHNVEAWVVQQLRQSNVGATFMFIGSEQKSFYFGDQSGTPDGIMITANKKYIFDIMLL